MHLHKHQPTLWTLRLRSAITLSSAYLHLFAAPERLSSFVCLFRASESGCHLGCISSDRLTLLCSLHQVLHPSFHPPSAQPSSSGSRYLASAGRLPAHTMTPCIIHGGSVAGGAVPVTAVIRNSCQRYLLRAKRERGGGAGNSTLFTLTSLREYYSVRL